MSENKTTNARRVRGFLGSDLMNKGLFIKNDAPRGIFLNMLIAAVSLFLNGFGVYLTIHANIGAGPWDVFTLGLANTLGILYGNANVAVSFTVIGIDILMREPIGLAMFIDAVVVSKTVDLFNLIDIVPTPKTTLGGIIMMVVGLFIIGYTQYFYMRAALGCGPRDTLVVGMKRHIKKVPIGAISIVLLSVITFAGYLLGGQVGVGTLIFAFGAGPIMQLAFHTMRFDATGIKHQNIIESVRVLLGRWRT